MPTLTEGDIMKTLIKPMIAIVLTVIFQVFDLAPKTDGIVLYYLVLLTLHSSFPAVED